MAEHQGQDRQQDDRERARAQPTGPQQGHVDEAAGGADSSPYETEPSGNEMSPSADLTTGRGQEGQATGAAGASVTGRQTPERAYNAGQGAGNNAGK
jgi:hypothetical protein